MDKKRDYRLDSLKGFLIILVILGHIPLEAHMKFYIYIFHMPLFILLSGYFTKVEDDRNKFYHSLVPIVKPLILFQFIYVGLDFFVKSTFTWTSLITPYWILWYLMSLMLWRLIVNFLRKQIFCYPVIFLSMAVVFSLLSGYCPIRNPFSIQRTINFFPFFLVGLYMRQNSSFLILSKLGLIVSFLIIVLSVLVVCCDYVPYSMPDMLRGAHAYGVNDFPVKLLLIIWSLFLSLSFFNIAYSIKILATIGKDSLIYYLFHGIIVRFMLKPFIAYYNIPTTILASLLSCVIIVLIIYFFSKLSFVRRMAYYK